MRYCEMKIAQHGNKTFIVLLDKRQKPSLVSGTRDSKVLNRLLSIY